MRIIHNYRNSILALVALFGFVFLFSPRTTYAELPNDSSVQSSSTLPEGNVKNCGNFLPEEACTDDLEGFVSYVANWMVGIFGALFVLMIVIAGVQMASASDSPDRLKAAKGRLTNAITGLVLLVSMRAILALLGITF